MLLTCSVSCLQFLMCFVTMSVVSQHVIHFVRFDDCVWFFLVCFFFYLCFFTLHSTTSFLSLPIHASFFFFGSLSGFAYCSISFFLCFVCYCFFFVVFIIHFVSFSASLLILLCSLSIVFVLFSYTVIFIFFFLLLLIPPPL